jgi:hypothetical protein
MENTFTLSYKPLKKAIVAICLLFFAANASAQTTFDWTGAISTNWSTPGNWESTTGGVTTNPAATYPGPADVARVGVLLFTNTSNFPIISSGGATSVGSIVWGTENYLTVSLTVNTNFTVNGSINNTSSAPGNGNVSAYVFNLSGTGTMLVTGSLNIGYDDGFGVGTPGNNNTFDFNSSLTHLTISGDINLNSVQGDTHHRGFVPSINVTGGIVTTSTIQSFLTNSSVYNSTLAANVTVGNSSGTPTATLQLTGANALPAFSPYIINTVTFNNPGATVEYSGASQTVYTDAPIANLSNTISYYSLKFSGTGVKTASGGNLNVAGDFTNTLANDASNYLSLSALGAPSTNTVNFNGTTQNLQGGGGNGTTFYNVECTNSGTKTMSSGTFYLADVGVLTMVGSSTQLAAGNKLFTLISDATSTATVAAIPLGCSVTGTVNVQRFVKGSYPTSATKRGYRIVSSTVYTGTVGGTNVSDVSWWFNGTIVTGPQSGGFDPSPFNNPSIYIYREDIVPSDANFTTGNFKGIEAINNSPIYNIGTQKRLTLTATADTVVTIPVGNGTLFFFRGNKTTSNGSTSGTKTSAPFNYPEDVTFTNTGTLNTGTVNVKIWYRQDNFLGYTNSPSLANALHRGYNLVGNPYASTINWEKFNRNSSPTKSSIYGAGFTVPATIWMFNPTNKQYEAYMQKSTAITTADTTTNVNPGTAVGSASNMIASGQGFLIRATSATQTMSFRETAKTNTEPTAAKLNILMGMPIQVYTAPEPVIRLQLIKDSINTDEIVTLLNDKASTSYLNTEDAEDMGGISAEVSLSALSSDSVKLCINRLPPPPKKVARVVPLLVTATATGQYQFKLSQLANLSLAYEVWLKDRFTHDSVSMHANSVYSFNIDLKNAATFGTDRFQLVIDQNPEYALRLVNFSAAKTSGGSLITWNVKNEFNTTAFYVERSIDGGETFQPIGSLQSDSEGSYNIIDKNPVIGQDQYRLKQYDLNNDVTYSNIVTLLYTTLSNDLAKIGIFPNPAANVINLTMENTAKATSYNIKIMNAGGVVIKQSTSQQPSWHASISDLKPGTYLVQVTNSSNKNVVGTVSFVKE